MTTDRVGSSLKMLLLGCLLALLTGTAHADDPALGAGGSVGPGGGRLASGSDGVGGIEYKPSPKPAMPFKSAGAQPPAGWKLVPPSAPGSSLTQGQWIDLGDGLLGGGGDVPVLSWCLAPSDPWLGALWIHGGPPNSPAWLVLGLAPLGLPFRGGVLVPSPDLVLSGLVLDAQGSLLLPMAIAPQAAPTLLVIQAWLADPAGPEGLSATNGMALLGP